MADIMNAADLGIGTFYNYFESKEEILMCLLGRLVHEVDEALKDMRAAKRPSYELLDAGCRITARFLDENRFLLPLPLDFGRVRLTAVDDEMLSEHVVAWCESRQALLCEDEGGADGR